MTASELNRLASQCAKKLLKQGHKLVLVESCTGGLVAASLVQTPGISGVLCGSWVVYRSESKRSWLRVSQLALRESGPVSAEVSLELALRALAQTPEAEWAAAVTGDLGPGAPAKTDGVVFIAVALRNKRSRSSVWVHRVKLRSRARISRQREASAEVMKQIKKCLV